MMTQQAIQLDLPHEKKQRISLNVSHRIARAFHYLSSIWAVEMPDLGQVYYLSNAGCEFDRFDTNPEINSLEALVGIKKKWSSRDIVHLKRGEIYEGNGVYQRLIDAGVYFEAFGYGDNPIIKVGREYIEIETTAWM